MECQTEPEEAGLCGECGLLYREEPLLCPDLQYEVREFADHENWIFGESNIRLKGRSNLNVTKRDFQIFCKQLEKFLP